MLEKVFDENDLAEFEYTGSPASQMMNDIGFQDTGQQVEREEEENVKLDNGFQGYYIDSNGDKQYFRHGKIKKEKKLKVKDMRNKNKAPKLEQRTLMPIDTRIPPSNPLVSLDPYDLRKDKIVPLFSPDQTTFNSAIKFDKPLKLEYIQRVYSEEYDDEVEPSVNVEEIDYDVSNLTVFERFLGTETVGDNGDKLFNPMPEQVPTNGYQRTALTPMSVLRLYSGFDEAFQQQILSKGSMPRMSGLYMLIFTFNESWGKVKMKLETSDRNNDPEIQYFTGHGFETANQKEFDCVIENGFVKKTGEWQMNVIFSSGQNYTYYGNTRKGWCNEGCFTLSTFKPTEESCFGTGHLFPYQHTMSEAANVLLESTTARFELDEGVQLTSSALNQYRKKKERLLKVIEELGSSFNGRGKRRTSLFNTEPSRLFFNELHTVRKAVWSNLQFVVERFQNKDAHVNKIYQRLQKKTKAVCQFGIDCPMNLLQ